MNRGLLARGFAARPGIAGRSGAPRGALGLVASLLLPVAPVAAAESNQQQPIVIVGERTRLIDLPERTIGGDDIASYGLGTIGELLGELASEDGFGADDAVILVDGRLVRGLGAIDDFPVEAVERIEVLPLGSAGRIGASPTKRAYNVVLRPQARVLAASASHRRSTDGGWSATEGDASFTAIRQPRRINFSFGARDEGALLESERDVDQLAGSADGLARSRTLRPARDRISAGLTAADQLAPWLRGSLTVKLNRNDSLARFGLSPTGDRLNQRSRSGNGLADVLLEAERGAWLATLGGTYNEQRQHTLTDLAAGDRRQTRSTLRSRALDLSVNGPLVALPAGSVRLTLGAGWNRDTLNVRFDGGSSSLGQTTREVRAGIDVPVASRAADFLAPLGELSVGAELRRSRVSGQGSLSTDTATVRWEPADWLRIFGSLSANKTPTSVGLLGDPLIETPGVRYFDPVRNETVDVTTISGGNPALPSSAVDERRLSIQLKPLRQIDLALSADYSLSSARNLPAGLPPASALIIATFPDRFIRDSDGTLVRVDLRPVSFARQKEEQLRTGVNLTLPLSKLGLGSTGDGARKGRLQLTASHTFLLRSDLQIRPGFDRVNLLSRSAVGLGGASRPRHQFDATLGYAERGLGVRLSADRRSVSFLDLASAQSADVLRFAPLTTFSLRAFAEGSRIAPGVEWLKGSRLSLTIVNLTNARERVRDPAGMTPLGYQPAYRDPLGRTVEVEFRTTF